MTGQEARDDEREALAKALFDVRDGEFDLDEWEDLAHVDRERWYCYADAALKVIRKHPEPEWEYGVRYHGEDRARRSEEHARTEVHSLGVYSNGAPRASVIARTKEVLPGPWVPVGEGEQS